ncbi:MAG: ATP-binding cassette domain-containing protein, partial [Muribaculaceae bacterium]|nr:ATP-binding cassette domain-containing protein [Muribaculaceae bacterium]
MSNVIEVNGGSKSYGKIRALDNVSFSVKEGEMFGLIGPDGAGKSSLYRMLATLLLPDSGTLTVLGLDSVKDYRALRSKIGYMPER